MRCGWRHFARDGDCGRAASGMAMRLLVGWPEFHCAVHTMDLWEGTAKRVETGSAGPLMRSVRSVLRAIPIFGGPRQRDP